MFTYIIFVTAILKGVKTAIVMRSMAKKEMRVATELSIAIMMTLKDMIITKVAAMSKIAVSATTPNKRQK